MFHAAHFMVGWAMQCVRRFGYLLPKIRLKGGAAFLGCLPRYLLDCIWFF